MIPANDALRFRLVKELMHRELSSGGWAASALSRQAALETSCLAALALKSIPAAVHASRQFLLRTQNPNGSWPAFDGDDREGSWTTSLAIIALRDYVPGIPARLRGFHWLLKLAGKESNWFWKWKFRTTDRHVRFDPGKYGWPWFPNTVSWVVPSSFAILALNQSPCACGEVGHIPARVNLAVEMLMDRACTGGGWNAGNGVVYGAPLYPHVDDTAVALLALSQKPENAFVQSSLLWLEKAIRRVRSPWSLAWAILALAAHGTPIDSTIASLRALPEICDVEDGATLAVMLLALDWQQTLSSFGVAI